MSEDVQDRLDRLESLVADQQATIARQRERIAALEATGADGPPGDAVTDGASVTRRDALKTGGLLALLAGGVGTTSADPRGQVGTGADPLSALYTAAIDGPVTDGQRLDSLVGNGLTLRDGRLETVTDVPELAVSALDISDDSGQLSAFTVDATVTEAAAVGTEGLTVTLAVVDSGGTTVYEDAFGPSDVRGTSTT